MHLYKKYDLGGGDKKLNMNELEEKLKEIKHYTTHITLLTGGGLEDKALKLY